MFVTHRAQGAWEATSLGRILFTSMQRVRIMLPLWWGMTIRTSPSRIRQLGKPWFVCKRSNIISWQVFLTPHVLLPKIVVHLGPSVVHVKLSQHQMKLVSQRYFFALDLDKTLYRCCSAAICAILWRKFPQSCWTVNFWSSWRLWFLLLQTSASTCRP